MIIGVGLDIVDIMRFREKLDETPALHDRLFHENERDLPVRSLAGRFAAKEALAKALGDPRGLKWIELEVQQNELGNPTLVAHGSSAETIAARGIRSLHLSISHDAGIAAATVIAEGDAP